MNKKKLKSTNLLKASLLIAILIVALAAGYLLNKNNPHYSLGVSQTSFLKSNINPVTIESQTKDDNLPTEFLINNFSFQTQAPNANWDELHDEACEEASLALVYYYLNNKNMTSETMEKEIIGQVNWEVQNWGVHKDLAVDETLQLAENYFHMNGKVKKNMTMIDIKKEIAAGRPVIVPTAGRLLGNPNFRSPGPVYHMVVAIGYDTKNIIVQDVGTRNGNHYSYNKQIFENAWHDWVGSPDAIEQGAKNYLVFSN